MFKKTITYTDFNGDDRTADFYFHLSKADLIRLASSGGLEEYIKRIIAEKDNEKIFAEFEKIIRLSVGVRSADGQTFRKDEEAQAQLLFSPAYDELMVELVTNAKAAGDFIAKLLPPDMQKQLMKELQKQTDAPNPFPSIDPNDTRPAWQKENRPPTDAELLAMDDDQLRAVIKNRQL